MSPYRTQPEVRDVWVRRVALLLVVALGCMWSGLASAQQRHALVVGIDAYANVPPLAKARNDAEAVSQALTGVGFSVTTILDANRRTLNRALSRFAATLGPGDEAVFYFAGHGVEVEGRNFLLPVDIPAMRPGDEVFLTGESLAADDVLSTIQATGARVSVLILDACRDNPFARSGTRSLGRSRGLARLEAPEGAFVMFSAGTGQAALDRLSEDDPDPNSVFTRALLPLLDEPGLPIHEIARRLRRDVEEMAEGVGHRQRPAYYDEVTGDFMFQPATAPASPASEPPVGADCASALPLWEAIGANGDLEIVETFAATYAAQCPVIGLLATRRAEDLRRAGEAVAPVPEAAPVVTAPVAPAPVDTAPVDSAALRPPALSGQVVAGVQPPVQPSISGAPGAVVPQGPEIRQPGGRPALSVLPSAAPRPAGLLSPEITAAPAPPPPGLRVPVETLETRAVAGDARAMVTLARRLSEGDGAPRNALAALSWARIAAERSGPGAGDPALSLVREMQQDVARLGADMSDYSSADWTWSGLQALARVGDVSAMREAGRWLIAGEGVDRDLDAAIGWYEQAADIEPAVLIELAEIYRSELRRYGPAFAALRQARDLGLAAADPALQQLYRRFLIPALRQDEDWLLDTLDEIDRDGVEAIQRDLTVLWADRDLVPDGIPGPATRAALRSFLPGDR